MGHDEDDMQMAVHAPRAAYVQMINISYVEPQPGRYVVRANVQIFDEEKDPVDGAIVDAEWMLPSGENGLQSRMTDRTGIARFTVSSVQTGRHQFRVTDVTKDDAVHRPTLNLVTLESIEVP